MAITRSKRKELQKLRRRGQMPMFFAGIMLAAAVLFVMNRVDAKTLAEKAPGPATAQMHDTMVVPLPVRAISPGERIGDIEFVSAEWPRTRLSSDFVTDIDPYRDNVATGYLAANSPLSRAALSRTAVSANAVIERIPEGMRAITITVDEESAVEGWARSGSYVDVIIIRNDTRESGLQSHVIAENVRILSAGRSANPGPASATAPKAPSTVTLLCSQEDALKIKTATKLGKLTFSLRGLADNGPTLATDMNQKAVFGATANATKVEAAFRSNAVSHDGRKFVLNGSRWIELKGSNEKSEY